MHSTFMGLEIGRRSVMAHQTALDVTGHNVANTNTPGYTRQEAIIITTPAYHAPTNGEAVGAGQVGTGVTIEDIRRLRDDFIDLQIRDENQICGYWQSLQMALDKIEVVLNEPSEQGLRGVIDNFWKSWQALSESPENESVRAVVLQRGLAVADTFHFIYNQLAELKADLNAQVKVKVDEVNSLAIQIANLNNQIQAITIAGKRPNDLNDRRDYLLDQLAKIVDAKVMNERNGMVTVNVNGTPLVHGINHISLGLNTDINGLYKVVWDTQPQTHPGTSITGRPAAQSGDKEVYLQSGELLGLLEARGPADNSSLGATRNLVPGLMDQLNVIAKTLVMTTNAIHRGGYSLNNVNGDYPDGMNFFDQPSSDDNSTAIKWAEYIRVNANIVSDVGNIAAASYRTLDANGQRINFGDGDNALRLAQLKHLLNTNEYWSQSDELNWSFPDTGGLIQGSFTVSYDGVDTTVTIPAPAEPYQEMRDVVQAIQGELKNLGLNVHVRSEGKRLVFYADNNKFTGVTAGTFPLTGFTAPKVRDGLIKQATLDDYWRSQVSSVGVVAQESRRMVDNQEILINQLEIKRQSVSGVSLDEEMTNMIRFQHAYNAAARYITTIDETIEVIVNRMGLVGR